MDGLLFSRPIGDITRDRAIRAQLVASARVDRAIRAQLVASGRSRLKVEGLRHQLPVVGRVPKRDL
jgi:hypothetical protein